MNGVVRAGGILLVLAFAASAALWAKAGVSTDAFSTITIQGQGTYYSVEGLPAKDVQIRISEPSIFNVTLEVYRGEAAGSKLEGNAARPLWEFDFHGPRTVTLPLTQRAVYLLRFENHDVQTLGLSVSKRQLAGVDRELLPATLIVGVVGAMVASGGLLITMRNRGK